METLESAKAQMQQFKAGLCVGTLGNQNKMLRFVNSTAPFAWATAIKVPLCF